MTVFHETVINWLKINISISAEWHYQRLPNRCSIELPDEEQYTLTNCFVNDNSAKQ